ncbi:hypothetical protein [Desulfovibrio sp. ZJ200]|uniref:glycosyltransferase family 2 protein n=1 Tax=Desulfovibrio sp. ZJ200 TaxID=2709792 RepID=UPI0013EDFE33|nr:hypothetical protein [Desulfovibrio sp. ZJ200]
MAGKVTPDTPLLKFLETSMTRRGWLGRIYGAQYWLQGGILSSTEDAPISVVSIRRRPLPDAPYEGFATLKGEGIPFQSVQIDIPESECDIPALLSLNSGTNIHCILSNAAPWYTALNLGAAFATGKIIIFLRGEPERGLLTAYRDMFQAHPTMLAARGKLSIPDLDACACQVTGSFALADDTGCWPVDLDENMAVAADTFFALGGFDESLTGGYGALDFSIRLFGHTPDFDCQRYVPQAQVALSAQEYSNLPLEDYLFQRQRSWLQLNDSLKRYLELYGKFWQEQNGRRNRV